MTIKEFLNYSDRVLETVHQQNDLIEFLSNIASFNQKYIDLYKQLRKAYTNNASTTQQKISSVIVQIQNQDKSTLSYIRKIRPFDFFTKLQSLIIGLQEIKIFGKELNDFLNTEVKKLIDLHTDAYSERNFDEIFSFVSYCNPFITKLERFEFTANVFIDNLQLEPVSIPEENEIIEIQIISQDNNLEIFTSFLSFIDEFYQNLCKAFNIHYSDSPLSIIKVESGSIWSKLFGKSELIKLIRDLIFAIGNYIRDLQTGKISREKFENDAKKADSVLKLIDKANKVGVKEENKLLLERAFNHAILGMSKSLPKTTTEILINEKPILKLETNEIKSIEGRKTLMLKSNDKSGTKKPSA